VTTVTPRSSAFVPNPSVARSRSIGSGIAPWWWPTTLCLGVAAAAAAAPDLARAAAPWPWIIALLVFGLPHGAADHLVNDRDRVRHGQRGGAVGFLWYGGWMLLAAGLVVLLPHLAVIAFLALTAWHFGAADLHDLTGPPGEATRRRRAWWTAAWTRGALVVTIPFAVNPLASWAPFALATQADVEPDLLTAFRGSAAVLAGACFVIACLVGPRLAIGRRTGALVIVETAAAALLLAVAPPLLAIGTYFLGIHAVRHTFRLARHDEVLDVPAAASTMARLVAVHRIGVPLLVPSLVVIGLWAWWIDGLSPTSIAAASIGFYLVATPPHHRLGLRLPPP